jgi:uncharacterized OsmC-like protein
VHHGKLRLPGSQSIPSGAPLLSNWGISLRGGRSLGGAPFRADHHAGLAKRTAAAHKADPGCLCWEFGRHRENEGGEYQIRAALTDTFGRLICSSRHHHFVVDGPAHNGCPGEALTPPEIFLAGVITCGVELVQVFARDQNLSLRSATGVISAILDRSNQARSDVTLFNSVRLDFTLTGVSQDEGHQLVEAFKARCPLYGTLAVATPKVDVNVSTQM